MGWDGGGTGAGAGTGALPGSSACGIDLPVSAR